MKKIYIIILNLGYWAFMLLLLALLYIASQVNSGNGPSMANLFILVGGYILIPSLISFYGSYFLLFRLFIRKVSKGKLVLAIVLLLLVSSLVAMINMETLIATLDVLMEVGIISFFLNSFNALFGFILHSFISWFTDLKEKERLNQKTKTLEMEMLKLKLDPHFLFNTINNIDVLIETDPSRASEYIIKLSSILRFYLYKTSESMISLKDEIRYIEEYIDLQKIRSANDSFVTLTIEGVINDQTIVPMVFIPFIENAFKHSQNKKLDSIDIRIVAGDEEITFTCSNQFQKRTENATGIGNVLIEDRLKLLYGDRFKLKTTVSENDYVVELKIPV